MTAQQALRARLIQLMQEKKLTPNQLAERSGVHHSTIDAILNSESAKNTGVYTVQKLCQGLQIDFTDFWRSPLFDHLDYTD